MSVPDILKRNSSLANGPGHWSIYWRDTRPSSTNYTVHRKNLAQGALLWLGRTNISCITMSSNQHHGVLNHRQFHCLFNYLFKRTSTENFNGCLMGYPVDIGWYNGITQGLYPISCKSPLITRFMEPIWSPSGAERTQVGSMLAPWTLLCYVIAHFSKSRIHEFWC